MDLVVRDRGIDRHQQRPDQSPRIVHNPEAEGQVLAAMAVPGGHKLWAGEEKVSGCGSRVSEIYAVDILGKEFYLLALGAVRT